MVAARPEAKFLDVLTDEESQLVRFDFAVGDRFADAVTVNLRELPGVAASPEDGYCLEIGEKLIRKWDGPMHDVGSSVLEWFATEKLIWERSRQRPGISGFDNDRDAAVYELLYVGIAKTGDTLDRLIKRGHKARMDILANEPQRHAGARVTDEIYLFMFRVEPTVFTSYRTDHVFSEDQLVDRKRIVADAEKAFVSLLQPPYNVVRFAKYPKGDDGLFNCGYTRYSYLINEDISFETAHGRIQGRRRFDKPTPSDEADFILVDGNTVKLYVSGVDFPASRGL